jgi:hypothetical protein
MFFIEMEQKNWLRHSCDTFCLNLLCATHAPRLLPGDWASVIYDQRSEIREIESESGKRNETTGHGKHFAYWFFMLILRSGLNFPI